MDYYGGTSLAGATNVPANAWSYFAFVRTGSTLNVYLNGVRDGTTTTSSNNSTNDFVLGRSWTNYASGELNGYVSGFRVSDAYARYTGTTMTVPTAPVAPTTASEGSFFLLIVRYLHKQRLLFDLHQGQRLNVLLLQRAQHLLHGQ